MKSPSRSALKDLIQGIGEGDFFSLVHEFYQRQHDDVMVGFFFAGKDLRLIAQGQFEFIRHAAGLSPQAPVRRSVASAHLNLPPILQGHFDRRLAILKELLEERGIPPVRMRTWLQFEESFRELVQS